MRNSGLLQTMVTISGLTLVSRIIGFVRDILTAGLLGAGPVADTFFVALKLPNFFRRLFAEGAFHGAFIPLFTAYYHHKGKRAAFDFASAVMSLLLMIVIAVTILVIMMMPSLIMVLAPGFSQRPEQFVLAVELTRITFPYLVFISLVALIGGVLNSVNRFAPFAVMPIVFNLGLIGALGLGSWVGVLPSYALAYGVSMAGLLQLLMMWYVAHREGITLNVTYPRFTSEVKHLLKLMGPGVFGAVVMQISQFIDIILGSLVSVGAISYLYYAERLYQLPLAVIGIALGTSLLPTLSRAIAANDETHSHFVLNRGLEIGWLLSLPAAIGLALGAETIILVLFQRGAFDALSTHAAAAALRAYALGLPAYVAVKVLHTGYFSHQDTVTPVKVMLVTLVINVVLAYCLIDVLGHVGIALATGVVAWLNVGLLIRGLQRRRYLRMDGQLLRRVPLIVLCAVLMGGVVYGLGYVSDVWLVGSTFLRFMALVFLVLGGVLSYGVLTLLFGATSLKEVGALFRGG